MAGMAFSSCNKDEVIEADAQRPQIVLDSEDGVYTAKVGREISISPDFKYVSDEDIRWLVDGSVVNIGPEWTVAWDRVGQYYATVCATNTAGTVEEEIRIDVFDLTPPVISMALPEGGLKVAPGTDCVLAPDIQHADMEDFTITWTVDGETVCDEMTYTFNRAEEGVYHISIIASNCDGRAEKNFDITVGAVSGYRVLFAPVCGLSPATTLYAFAGRKVCLTPAYSGFTSPRFYWELNCSAVDCDGVSYSFTPEKPGDYKVRVCVTNGTPSSSYRKVSRNAAMLADGASAEITVKCVDADEADRERKAGASASPYATNVFEWTPAPGQFINETSSIGGMTGNETTPEAAAEWAKKRLDSNFFVSLGSFGGYISVGFDHSIPASGGDYDFYIEGNAFLSENGGSNEPGVVWVMQDVNGNGLPDDQWYELAGSEASHASRNFAVSYYRPSGVAMDVQWTASDGSEGTIKYLSMFHKQDYYYPAWVNVDSYTLYGTLLPANNSQDPTTGYWNNAPFAWGYADNAGSDNLQGSTSSDSKQRTGFKISNAVYSDGTPVKLKYVDFIKVQTGVLANSGVLGEISTEVCGFADCSK